MSKIKNRVKTSIYNNIKNLKIQNKSFPCFGAGYIKLIAYYFTRIRFLFLM